MKWAFVALFLLNASFANAQSNIWWRPVNIPDTASLSVNNASAGITIPSDFVGISTEVGDLVSSGYYQGTSGTWNSNASAASFISLLQLLGSTGSFRIGGHSSDSATPPALTSGIASNLNTFLMAVGANWKPIYNLDLVANNSATAATQAGLLATAIGPSNIIFQFGNEPGSNGFVQGTYTTAWDAYFTAVTGAVSGAGYAAADDQASRTSWASGLTPGMSGLQEFTFHYYDAPGFEPFSAVLGTFPSLMSTWSTAQSGSTSTINGGARVTETGVISSGGYNGISNALVASTWILNEGIILAPLGYRGINAHTRYTAAGGGVAYYNPLFLNGDGNFSAAGEFYGLYLLSKIAGQQILSSTLTGSPFIRAMATKRASGNANILVTNSNTEASINFIPSQSSGWSAANVLLLTAPLGCGDTNITIGGASIGESGAWSGSPYSISNGQTVLLPPCGAALIQIQP